MRRGYQKYGAVKTIVDGISFPSKLHAGVYCQLKLEQSAGLIRNIEMEVRVDPPLCRSCGIQPAPSVKVDFKVTDCKTGKPIWVEAKGAELSRWVLFRNWWKEGGPGMLRIYKAASGGRVKLVEEINP